MEALQNNMKCLYYKNLETYAKKHKIDINISNYIEIAEVSDVSETVETEVANNTETYTEDFVYKKPWNKLNVIHKKIKLDEYVNNLDIEDSEIKKLPLTKTLIDVKARGFILRVFCFYKL
jgi:hypothetical protein